MLQNPSNSMCVCVCVIMPPVHLDSITQGKVSLASLREVLEIQKGKRYATILGGSIH